MSTPAKTRQHIRYVTAPDGTRLAWAESGAGPILVKAANWLTHLEYEWESPVWRHWLHFFSAHCRFVRYDERGCGMSDWQDGVLSLEQWAGDLGSVIEAARPDAPVTLLGISQGAATCIQYAIDHPERVARMILYGGYARGWKRRGTTESQAVSQAMVDLMRVAWGKDNPTFRQVFTSRFIPGGSPEQLQWFNDLCLKTTPGEVAARIQESRGDMDVTADLGRVKTPTLVLHARDDAGDPDRGRAAARERHSGRRVRRARLAQPHPARARTGVAAVSGRGARVSCSPASPAAIPCSRPCRRANVRCWRSWPTA